MKRDLTEWDLTLEFCYKRNTSGLLLHSSGLQICVQPLSGHFCVFTAVVTRICMVGRTKREADS